MTNLTEKDLPTLLAEVTAENDKLRAENEAYRARVIADGKLFEESGALLKNTLAENVRRLRAAAKKLLDANAASWTGGDATADAIEAEQELRAMLSEGDDRG